MEHGTRSTYVNHGCRCEPCRKASREYQRVYLATGSGARPGWGASHGASGYNRGCRCHICRLQARNYRILYQYGITPEHLEELLTAQERKCAICSRPFKDAEYVLDHSHESGNYRGILCSPCNTGLGKFQDDPNLISRAIGYLESK